MVFGHSYWLLDFVLPQIGAAPLAVPDIFLAPKGIVSYRPLRNKSSRFFCHRQRSMIYSHSLLKNKS